MARALGVGGVFFRSKDRARLIDWYKKWLGIEAHPDYGFQFKPETMPKNGGTVWSAFPHDTKYFGPSGQSFMINLVVDDLDGALAQVREGGAALAGDPTSDEYGKFGWFVDPDGNKVELWQPPA